MALLFLLNFIVQIISITSLNKNDGLMQFFLIDCDKSLAFTSTEAKGKNVKENHIDAYERVSRFVSTESLVLLDEISMIVPIICVSGIHAADMESRQRRFPMIDYWVLENGGRIFSRSRDNGNRKVLKESLEFNSFRSTDINADFGILNEFANRLRSEGFELDSERYKTLFRVKTVASVGSSTSEVQTRTVSEAGLNKIMDQHGSFLPLENDNGDVTSPPLNESHTEHLDSTQNCTDKDLLEHCPTRDVLTLESIIRQLPSQLTIRCDSNGYAIIQPKVINTIQSVEWIAQNLFINSGGSAVTWSYMYATADELDIDPTSVHNNANAASAKHFCGPVTQLYLKSNSGEVIQTIESGHAGSARLLTAVLQSLKSSLK